MKNISREELREIQESMQRPEGTLFFSYFSDELFDADKRGGKIWELSAGQHFFLIERTDDLILRFYHSCPGTGTRIAAIDLRQMSPCNPTGITITWAPTEINLYAGPLKDSGDIQSSVGTVSKRGFRIGRDRAVYQVGDEGVEVMGISVYQGQTPILLPTALEAWKATIQAVEVLATGTSTEGYIFEVVSTNLALSILVTGFEAYCKTRFLEIEGEGIRPDVVSLLKAIIPKRELDAGIEEILNAEAVDVGKTVLTLVVEQGRINFQNYLDCKRAYNKAYGIKFGEIGLDSDLLDRVQKLIKYRHRIIHVSPLIGMLNQPEVPKEEPVFPKRELAKEAANMFGRFIDVLHAATLKLRRID
jgi:hypothetical protein